MLALEAGTLKQSTIDSLIASGAPTGVPAAALPIEVGAGDAIIHSVRQPLLNAPPS